MFNNEQKKRADFKQDLHPSYPQIELLFILALRNTDSGQVPCKDVKNCHRVPKADQKQQYLYITMKDSVTCTPNFQIARRELKAQCVAECF